MDQARKKGGHYVRSPIRATPGRWSIYTGRGTSRGTARRTRRNTSWEISPPRMRDWYSTPGRLVAWYAKGVGPADDAFACERRGRENLQNTHELIRFSI